MARQRQSVVLGLIAAQWVVACASVQPTVAAPSTTATSVVAPSVAEAPARDGPLPLWRIEDAQGAPAGFLFGTIHALPEAAFLDARVFRALRRSDALVIELSPDPTEEQQAMLERFTIEHGMWTPDEAGLDQRLPPALYASLAATAGKAGVPGILFARMRPWLASTVLSVGAAQQAGLDTDNSVESQLVAGRNRIPIVELETLQEQLEALSSTDDALLLDELRVASNEDPAAATRALYDAWRRGDAPRLEELTFAPLKQQPGLQPMYERMFFQRNEAMARKILQRLDAHGHPFIGVGVGHVVGARGLIAALQGAGYRLTQVTGPDAGPRAH